MTALVPVELDRDAILRHLNLNPNDVSTQALLLICQRYGLDPLMKHMVLISGKPYVTRDGYLHIAHSTGQLDGIEVVDQGDSESEWWAKVAVYRKDMGRPFTYTGRYPKDGQQRKYGPEMAVKTAEVMAMRRAFDVTGVGAVDEQWDEHIEVMLASAETHQDIRTAIAGLSDDEKSSVLAWWTDHKLPPISKADRLSEDQADLVLERLGLHRDAIDISGAEIVGGGEGPVTPVTPVDTNPDAAPAEVTERLLARLDKLPDVVRRECEDALADRFGVRFPNELTAADVPEASKVITDHERREMPAAERAMQRARQARGEEVAS